MKTLNLHCDYIKFKGLKKALKKIDDLAPNQVLEGSSEECLVVLVAVEKGDNKETAKKLVEDIKNISEQVKTKNIVLYPYAHLSSNLGSPESAIEILDLADKGLKGFEVVRAPFGYYKSFELKVKGHPLSELSREIRGVEGEAIEEKYDVVQLLREISKSKLDTSKLKDNDHRILGRQMDLFSFNDVAPGMVFWHNKGLTIYNELVKFWREQHLKSNYEEIRTPQVMDAKLWKVSGHWDKYKENNFVTEYEKRPFLVKPMNCPGGMMVYKATPKSYKDLPLRVGEMGTVHRCELSGVLAGLFRVIQFTQDDAHLFCANEKQVKEEIKGVMDMITYFYNKFDLKFDHVELSTRPEKRIGSDKQWDVAEKILEDVLKEKKIKYKINEGDGAFYGPKIDFHVGDSLGRTWQLSTIQLDFALPERFELEYTDKDNKKKRPIMLHRVIYGSLERFIGIILEHTNGRLPTWLAPVQVRVLSFTDRNQKYGEKVFDRLKREIPGLRIDKDFRQTTVPQKVKEAELMRVPYILVVGDKEEKEDSLAVRVKGNSKIQSFKIDEFVKNLRKEIEERN
ncbi:MAG: threonine--tRNA ligase [Nanoarchaeota archaeon]|nr:threonine--tRNA ligase [Nanoarchaeota archaeon]